MSDKPKEEKAEEQEAPKPLTDEQVYTAAAASDPRVTSVAQTEEEAKAVEEAAKKPAVEEKKSDPAPAHDTKGKHS